MPQAALATSVVEAMRSRTSHERWATALESSDAVEYNASLEEHLFWVATLHRWGLPTVGRGIGDGGTVIQTSI
jgi:hypothetical protein